MGPVVQRGVASLAELLELGPAVGLAPRVAGHPPELHGEPPLVLDDLGLPAEKGFLQVILSAAIGPAVGARRDPLGGDPALWARCVLRHAGLGAMCARAAGPVGVEMSRGWWLGCGIGALSVATGAFGAHGLKGHLSVEALTWWETGARYAALHAAPCLAAAALSARGSRAAKVAVGAFGVGVLLFSGSLWAMALTGLRPLGAVTPFGGVALLGGWLALGLAGAQLRRAAPTKASGE